MLPYTTLVDLFTVKSLGGAWYVRTMNNQALIDAVHELLRLKEVQTEAYTKACDRGSQKSWDRVKEADDKFHDAYAAFLAEYRVKSSLERG